LSLGGGLRGVSYATNYDGVVLEAMKPFERGVLWMTRDAPKEKVAVAERLLTGIAERFVWRRSDGFCVGEGSVQMRSLSEVTRQRWVHRSIPGFRAELQTSTHFSTAGDEPDLSEERGFAKAVGGALEVLRERTRTMAGLPCREALIAMRIPGEQEQLRLTWDFAGDASRPFRDPQKVWEVQLSIVCGGSAVVVRPQRRSRRPCAHRSVEPRLMRYSRVIVKAFDFRLPWNTPATALIAAASASQTLSILASQTARALNVPFFRPS
jgi:hypothetical protein